MDERCENCKFWNMYNSDYGRCRRYPPTVTADDYESPKTDHNDWCGEWQVKEAAPAAKDEEYCDYYRVFDLRNLYEAGCNHKYKVSREFATYCPNCGKRIRFHE